MLVEERSKVVVTLLRQVKKSKDDSFKVTDEVFNTILHLVGMIFALVGAVYLIAFSDDAWKYVGFSVYGFSLIFLFLSSVLHHGWNLSKKGNEVLRKFDYSAVYLLIAGTFTPLCLVTLRGKFGWVLFGVVWFLTIIGITMKFVFQKMPKWVTNTIYISMGWLGLIFALPLFAINIGQTIILGVGGIFYTIGAFIFYYEQPNIIKGKFGFHEIWHVFVLLGAFTHWLMMYIYVL